MSNALNLTGVRAGYGDLEVLHDLSLVVAEGEFLALLGPNGSGKTTLLNLIAGHLRPRAGTVEIFGSASRRPAHKLFQKGLSFIADDRQLFPSLTLQQTLRLVPGAVRSAIKDVPELERLMRRRVRLLSGGEQQMLAVARALACRPRLLVIDELSQGLAPMISDRLLGMLRAGADAGTAVVVVEQNVEKVLRVADRGAVLRRGTIVGDRPAAQWAIAREELAEIFLS